VAAFTFQTTSQNRAFPTGRTFSGDSTAGCARPLVYYVSAVRPAARRKGGSDIEGEVDHEAANDHDTCSAPAGAASVSRSDEPNCAAMIVARSSPTNFFSNKPKIRRQGLGSKWEPGPMVANVDLHLIDEIIRACLLGTLDGDSTRRVDEHLDSCQE
jgi:hypothetical protein